MSFYNPQLYPPRHTLGYTLILYYLLVPACMPCTVHDHAVNMRYAGIYIYTTHLFKRTNDSTNYTRIIMQAITFL